MAQTLEDWLSIATRGLAQGSAERVRAEIQQHCEAATENGDYAIAALGDPNVANGEYRKVLLTQQEEALGPTLFKTKPTLAGVLGALVLLAPVLWLQYRARSPLPYAILIAIFSTAPMSWLWPPNSSARIRYHAYVNAGRDVVVIALMWWYRDWGTAVGLGALLLGLNYWMYSWRASIFRKLEGNQTFRPFPGEPELTHNEAIFLNTLRNGHPYEAVSIAFTSVMIAGMTWWLPATFAPLLVWWAAIFLTRLLPIYTEERSRWYRSAKWIAMVIAAALPVIVGARIPWAGAAYLAFIFLLIEQKRIALRRKLPITQWPKQLYV